MAKDASISSSTTGSDRRKLRFHQTPIRRSPRFLNHKKEEDAHEDPRATPSIEKPPQRYSTKCLTGPLCTNRSAEAPKRSVEESEVSKGNVGIGTSGVPNGAVKECRRRSARLMDSAKVSERAKAADSVKVLENEEAGVITRKKMVRKVRKVNLEIGEDNKMMKTEKICEERIERKEKQAAAKLSEKVEASDKVLENEGTGAITQMKRVKRDRKVNLEIGKDSKRTKTEKICKVKVERKEKQAAAKVSGKAKATDLVKVPENEAVGVITRMERVRRDVKAYLEIREDNRTMKTEKICKEKTKRKEKQAATKVSEKTKVADSVKVLEIEETGVVTRMERVRRDRKANLEIVEDNERMKMEKICKEKIERKEKQAAAKVSEKLKGSDSVKVLENEEAGVVTRMKRVRRDRKVNLEIGEDNRKMKTEKICKDKIERMEKQAAAKVSEKPKATDSVMVLENEEAGVITPMERVKRDRKMNLEIGEDNKRTKTEKICKEKIKRKEKQREECMVCEGWTTEQQAALHKAYLVARPSPHFWKKVSKMVPGKSAQECFDRVNGSLQTPPQHQPRSRSRMSNISPIGSFNLSGDKSTQPAVPRTRRLSSRKKTLIAQKTVRHLLKKHCLIDQTHEADYFSVLENSSNTLSTSFPEIGSPETPDCVLKNPSFLQMSSSSRSSTHRKMLSRFKPLSEAAKDPSPQVLKKIKNVALHEKYIDRLHCREARRKSAKTASSVSAKDGELRSVVLKAAKTALISEARDAISEFQHMQANACRNDGIDDDDEYDIDQDDEDASPTE